MNWSEFFTEWGGGTYFEYFIEDLSQKGEIILIDSRTGVTELGGICTHHLADLVLLLTASNEQNREGSARMVESLNRPEVRALHGGRDVAVLPIASRIDTRGGGSLAEKFVSEFGKQFADLATKWAQQGVAFLELSRIPYVGAYSFQERVIAREPDDPARAEPLAPYLAITEAVVQYGVKHHGLSLRERVSNESTVVATSRLHAQVRGLAESVRQGEFYLAWEPQERVRADRFATGLREAGLKLWCDAAVNFYQPGQISSIARFDAVDRSAGYLVLQPERPAHAWLQAEANAVLARWASAEDYRAFVLSSWLYPSNLRELQRIPRVALDATSDEGIFQRINAEISVARPMPSEPLEEAILGQLGSPQEAESRFFLGRERPFKSLLEQAERVARQGQGVLAVVGGWDAEKSSYLRAGLLPALHRGWIQKPGCGWNVAYGWIEGTPEERVENALAEMVISAGQLDASRSRAGILRWLAESKLPLALLIDKCEKLVWSERSGLFALIDELQKAVSNGLFLVLSVREREWDSLQPLLPTNWPQPAVWKTPPVEQSDMRRFLAGGAKLFGVDWELDALERATSEANKFLVPPRTLGLVLREALVLREGSRITFGSYSRTGGVEAVIAADAGRYLSKLAGAEKEAAKTLLLRLVPISMSAKREMSIHDFVELSQTQENGRRIGAQLLERGILEIESSRVRLRTPLIARVEPLTEWLHDASDQVEATATLELATVGWEAAKRPWITSIRLEAGKHFHKVEPKLSRERDFLSASRRGVLRRVVVASLAPAVAAVAALIIAGNFTSSALEELRKAKAELAAARAREETEKGLAEKSGSELQRLKADLESKLHKANLDLAAAKQAKEDAEKQLAEKTRVPTFQKATPQ